MIIYYSRTGNTEKMAKAIKEGLHRVPGMEVESKFDTTPEEVMSVDAVLIGSPTYHHDMAINIKNLLENTVAKNINMRGKLGACFGSYGWSGEAPKLVQEIMKTKFEMKVIKPPLQVKYKPNDKDLEECRQLGENVAKTIAGLA